MKYQGIEVELSKSRQTKRGQRQMEFMKPIIFSFFKGVTWFAYYPCILIRRLKNEDINNK